MSKFLLAQSTEARTAIVTLFQQAPPVLVEVQFPGAGTSPDWYLCEEEEELEAILERLGPGTVIHLNSVWDLKNVRGEIRLRK
jgi:hypothetical protein